MRITKVEFRHPISGYTQSYGDWIDDGYDYDLLAAGLVPVVPSSVQFDSDVVEWCQSITNSGFQFVIFDEYSKNECEEPVDTTTYSGVDFSVPQEKRDLFNSLFADCTNKETLMKCH